MRDRVNTSHNFDEPPDPWAQIIAEIISKIVGARTSTTFKFENLEIDSPQIKDPSDMDLISVKWIINGKILLTTTDLFEE
jgi:hypothetical protein